MMLGLLWVLSGVTFFVGLRCHEPSLVVGDPFLQYATKEYVGKHMGWHIVTPYHPQTNW